LADARQPPGWQITKAVLLLRAATLMGLVILGISTSTSEVLFVEASKIHPEGSGNSSRGADCSAEPVSAISLGLGRIRHGRPPAHTH